MVPGPAHEIRLLGVPAGLFIESQNQQQDLIRELTLVEMGNRSDVTRIELSHRLAGLIRDILHHYSEVRSTTRQQALDALARGEDTVDLTLHGGADIVAALRRWLVLVEQADVVCSEGALLTVAASPAVRALRRWYVDAITRCVDTGEAQRWDPGQSRRRRSAH